MTRKSFWTPTASAASDFETNITDPQIYDRLHYDGTEWVNTSQIWKPLLDDAGDIVTDSDGDPTMGLAPA